MTEDAFLHSYETCFFFSIAMLVFGGGKSWVFILKHFTFVFSRILLRCSSNSDNQDDITVLGLMSRRLLFPQRVVTRQAGRNKKTTAEVYK